MLLPMDTYHESWYCIGGYGQAILLLIPMDILQSTDMLYLFLRKYKYVYVHTSMSMKRFVCNLSRPDKFPVKAGDIIAFKQEWRSIRDRIFIWNYGENDNGDYVDPAIFSHYLKDTRSP